MGTGRDAKKGIDRRGLLKGTIATVGLIFCEAVSPSLATAIVPVQACGCPRRWPISAGHHCTVHDEAGKRWEDYTFDDVVAENRDDVVVCGGKKDDLCCYACVHPSGDPNKNYSHYLKKGERGVWTGGGYYEPEWDFECAEAYRRKYINVMSIDWREMAYEMSVKDDGKAIADAEFLT